MKPLVLSTGSRPVVCLHGFLGEPEDWRPLAELLGPEFGVVACPLPGHGAPLVHHFEEGASRVVEFLRARPPAHLVGYSMGGRLALAAALRLVRDNSCAIRSLTIISSTPGLEVETDRIARAHADDRLAERMEQQGMERFVREWYAQPLFASLAERPALLRALVIRRARGTAAGCAAALRALTVGRQESLWKHLPELKRPALWIAGDADEKYRAIAAGAFRLCPHARLLTVPRSGHVPHLERPEFVAEHVRRFLLEN